MRFTRRTLLHSRSARLFFSRLNIYFAAWFLVSNYLADGCAFLFFFTRPGQFHLLSIFVYSFSIRSAERTTSALVKGWKLSESVLAASPRIYKHTSARYCCCSETCFSFSSFHLDFSFTHTHASLHPGNRVIYSLFSRVSSFHSCVYSMLYYGVHFTFVLY